MHQNLHPPIGSPCIRSQTTPNSPNTTTTRSRSPRHPRQRPHPSDSVATRGDSLAHSREAGARLDSFALNTTTRQGGHSVTPLDEGCGTDSPLEVTESPPLVPKGSNGSEVSTRARVHVSRPGVHVGSEEETRKRNNINIPPPPVDVDPGPSCTDRCVQPAPLDADGCRHESAFPNFADASEGAQTENPGTDPALGTVHAGGRPDLDPLLDDPSVSLYEQGPVRAARLSADDGPKSPTEGTPSSCTTPHDVHVLKDEGGDQLRQAPGLPSTPLNDVTSPQSRETRGNSGDTPPPVSGPKRQRAVSSDSPGLDYTARARWPSLKLHATREGKKDAVKPQRTATVPIPTMRGRCCQMARP